MMSAEEAYASASTARAMADCKFDAEMTPLQTEYVEEEIRKAVDCGRPASTFRVEWHLTDRVRTLLQDLGYRVASRQTGTKPEWEHEVSWYRIAGR